jgi:drug/metabolite transporter (DMT)-like permease
MKIDWKKKLTSRKLWMAVAGFISGVIVLCTSGATEQTISGCVMALGSVVAYIVGEGLTDAASIKKDDTQE